MIGFLNINKPVGSTSAQVVAQVKRKLNLPKGVKIGHMGTLDKLASGVLPIAVGRATRLFDYMLTKRKYYRAEFTFGYQTDTLDCDGEIVERSEVSPNLEQIEDALGSFLGDIDQMPPQYSAKVVGGRRASDLARLGQEVNLKPARIHIYEFRCIENKGNNTYTFEIECSAGTYIRSLCRDLAKQLNSVATMTALCRTRAGVFMLDEAIDIDEVSEDKLLPADIVLGALPKINCDTESVLTDLLNGKKITIDRDPGLYAFYSLGALRGLCEIDENQVARMKTWL